MSSPPETQTMPEGAEIEAQSSVAGDVVPKKTKLVEVNSAELGGTVEGRVSLRKNPNFFTFILYDGSAEVQIVARGDQWKEISESMQDDECYRITAFKTRKNDPAYNTTFHSCEIHLIKISSVERIQGEAIPQYPFTKVKEVAAAKLNSIVNMIAIVYNVEPEWESNPNTTRFVNLVDDTLKFVTLRLWGELNEALDAAEGKCVTLYNLKVKRDENWLPRNVDSTLNTKFKLIQDSDRSGELQKWFDSVGRGEKFTRV